MCKFKKKSQTHINSSKTVPGVRGEGEIGRGWQRVWTFSYKVNKVTEDLMYDMVTAVDHTVLYNQLYTKVNMWDDECVNLIVWIFIMYTFIESTCCML